VVLDGGEEERRGEEGCCINEHGHWRAEQINKKPAEPWAKESSGGTTELKLAVPFNEILTSNQGGEIRLVCNVEEDGEHADQESNNDQLGECQNSGEVADWDRQDQHGAAEITTDQHGASREPIH
jgi:hypothetical protein